MPICNHVIERHKQIAESLAETTRSSVLLEIITAPGMKHLAAKLKDARQKDGKAGYTNRFECLPKSARYRMPEPEPRKAEAMAFLEEEMAKDPEGFKAAAEKERAEQPKLDEIKRRLGEAKHRVPDERGVLHRVESMPNNPCSTASRSQANRRARWQPERRHP